MKLNSFARVLRLTTWLLLTMIAAGPLPPLTRAQSKQESRMLQQVQPVTAWPAKSKRWALVIGVDQYRDGNITSLRGAANDAAALKKALVDYGGFPADQVVMLSTDQGEQYQPTRINILTYLSNLASQVPKDGLLLVAFSGHGIEREGQAYLIPMDARLTDDISLLEESAISVARMHARIRTAHVGQVVVLLDACRNDPGGRSDSINPLSAAYVRGFNFDVRNREVQAFATVYATAVGQRAYEYQDKRQGYFTWAVVEGLKGGAANERGEVTLASLVKYVEALVSKQVTIDLGAGKQQRPFAAIEGYRADELVVAVGAPRRVPNAPSATAEDAGTVEADYWAAIKDSTKPEDFRAYLVEFPNGRHAPLARLKIGEAASVKPSDNLIANKPSGTNPTGVNAVAGAPAAGTRMKSPAGIEFVYIPAGSFLMGSSDGEAKAALTDERNLTVDHKSKLFARGQPQHKVSIGHGYYLGRYEVTQGEWQAVMGNNPSYFKDCGGNCPVEQVSWDEVQQFVDKLNARNDGWTYRLPTEAEWEYAARADTTTPFAFGSSLSSTQANFRGMFPYGNAAKGLNREKTTPVGSFAANPWGLFDMHGNVWEWVQDSYDENYYSNSPAVDPPGPATSGYRIMRGGSWYDFPYDLRSGNRDMTTHDSRNNGWGVRIAATVRSNSGTNVAPPPK